ncbi:molecular chaperone HtpG [Butyrivibrio sp. MC2013]|uniref:molecular chaperone HtpG n=1 Tax=Butyrivibrio sp. MC2013 TaxID=1280686 RepID=UPI0003FE596D|nr:molecular chaperone HtpG [Butyrivibrio sp. MC2013]
MADKRGNLSINSENMFPIIKKWLYSDHDIFYREIISNACDAITKIRKMDAMGDYELPEGYTPRVDIVLNDKDKTITVTDNGIGMTEAEVEEYINQVAFSGATDFLEKYKDKASDEQIIGHFGLGFYSTFMVAESVDIDTLSYKEGATPVHWTCDGGSEFEMSDGNKQGVGTTITLHLSDDCLEFCNEYKAREVVQKYCSFMPYEIYISRANEDQTETIKESEKRPDDEVIEVIVPEEKKDADKDGAEKEENKLKIRRRPRLMNDTHPLWTKTPSDCTKDDYLEFYRKTFNDYKEPLFWIHLNMDYPFNLKGILYFPKINMEFESIEGVIKLYNNQVFIADNIKEVIPDYLMLLKGVIDCPDLPLNVSRSALQNDGFVKKISDYISKKVAEKLSGMCKTDRENYDKYWDDIAPFIKYGYLKDEKFAEKINDFILFKDLDGQYHALPEALQINKEAEEAAEEEEKTSSEENTAAKDAAAADNAADNKGQDSEEDKEPRTIYYVTDEQQQSQYIKLFKAQKMTAFVLNTNIDTPFMQAIESKNQDLRFQRIDAEISDTFKSKISKKAEKEFDEAAAALQEKMRKALSNDKLTVSIRKLKDKKISSVLTVSEETRRMQDMMRMYAMNGMGMPDMKGEGQTLILNANHPLVKYVMDKADDSNNRMICEQLYDLARIQNEPLSGDDMAAFISRSNKIMELLTGAE